MEIRLRDKDIVALTICIGVIQIAFYYLVGASIRGDGGFSIAQPDTLLYCQAARRIVEGHAFSFSEGTSVSTGTTSVLYPFVLAIPYCLGLKGDSLIRAGFFLNATFYIISLVGWSLVSFRLFKDVRWRLCACILIALFGPLAYCALAQSDIGLWLAISSLVAWGLLSRKQALYALLLFLAPWVRPEGMILAAAFGIVLGWRSIGMNLSQLSLCSPQDREDIRRDFWVLVGAIVSSIGVFVLNYSLTGCCQFSSVSNKGYFTNYPFAQAVYVTAIDALQMAKAYVLGIPRDAPRDFMFLPFISAGVLWMGIVALVQRERICWRIVVWLIAITGSFATVATSGWQDKNLDRYLAWTWPVFILLVVEGCRYIESRFSAVRASRFLILAHIVFFAVMSVVFGCAFYYSGDRADRVRAFAEQCEELMEPKESVGVWSRSGIAYEFSNRRVAHLCGIYSPEFFWGNPVSALETLKREPATRFRYYFYKADEDPGVWEGAQDVVLGKRLAVGPEACELREAEWSAFDKANRLPKTFPQGVELVDRIDIGYEKDEVEHGYSCQSFYHMPSFASFIIVGQLGIDKIVEGGRFIFGADEMDVEAVPGKDLHVVMRTYPEKRVCYERDLNKSSCSFALNESLKLGLTVDGKDVGMLNVEISSNGFSDVTFVIPGASVKSSRPRISFVGAHIACGYWFFQ